jgi:hypothetical protein
MTTVARRSHLVKLETSNKDTGVGAPANGLAIRSKRQTFALLLQCKRSYSGIIAPA